MTQSDRFEVEKPVSLVDRLVVKPGHQQTAYALMIQHYAPHVAPRGLRLVGAWLSPPFEQPGVTSELTVIWEYASLAGLWGARMAEEDDPVARRIWSDIAAVTESRTRHLARSTPMPLPPPDERGRLPVPADGLSRTILFVHPRDPVPASQQADWIAAAVSVPSARPDIVASRAGFHGEYSFLPGDLTWDIASRTPIEAAGLLALLPGAAELVDVVEVGLVLAAGLRDPRERGTKRTVLVRARADADAPAREAFERALADTPLYITAIDNWRLSRVTTSTGAVGWTHCFEQEVADSGVFVGDYLNHPYHWAVVERLFHPDAPERIGDAFLHTLYPIDRSVLSEI